MNTQHQQAARIVAGTLTLLARELREAGPPFDLWTPALAQDFIREAAAMVGRGAASALWVDERHPARGLALYRHSDWESEFLGFPAARLMGPFMVAEDQADREERARRLAALAVREGRAGNHRLITVKTFHDPAVLRAFLAENFVLAEIGAALSCQVPQNPISADCPAGFVILEEDTAREAAAETVAAMGDFFYDGHWRHDLIPGPNLARRLWSQAALEDLSGAASPALVLWDQRRDQPAAMATVRQNGPEKTSLSILAVAAPYRGRSFGRLMMLEILSRLIGRAVSLRAETASYNLPALKLYAGLGFKHIAPLVSLHHHLLQSPGL